MSRSDRDSFVQLISSSSSRPTSKDYSVNQDHPFQPTRMAPLNVLFLGETGMGKSSLIDLVAGPEQQSGNPCPAGRHDDDARSITLDGKTFTLRSSPTNESMSPSALREGIQNTLTHLGRSGVVHLLVYCMNASHSTRWIHDVHRAIVSFSTLSLQPAVAVIAGIPDTAVQARWWSNNEAAFAEQGLRFDGHAFIQIMTTDAPSLNHVSKTRHVLRALILQHCPSTPNSETDSDFQRTASYKQQYRRNSFRPSLTMLAGKPPSRMSTSSKAIDIVLLGEIGVGKSSLINLIATENVAEVSPDSIGCTKTAVKYTFEEKGRTFNLYDTPGLVDPQMGIEVFVSPIDTIQNLIRSLGDGNGPDLLLFCIDNSKPTTALRRNYRLFCKVICGGKVPSALTIMKLEEGEDANEWWGRYGATVRRYGIDCSGYFGFGCWKRHSGSGADLEKKLRESLLSFLVTCTDRRKNKMDSLRSSMSRTVVSVASFLRAQEWTLEKALISQCGLEEQTARELASRIVPVKGSCNDRAQT